MTDSRPTDLGQPKGGRFAGDKSTRLLFALRDGFVCMTVIPGAGRGLDVEMTPEEAEDAAASLCGFAQQARIARGGGG